MKSSKRVWKKVFANVSVGLLIVAFFGNSIAGQFAGQINSFLGTSTSRIEAELKEAGLAKAEEVEAEGAVLLKNNGVLPLQNPEVSLFGATASSPVYGGTGSGAVNTADAPSYVDALTASGLTVTNAELMDWYKEEEYGREFSSSGEEINEARWKNISESDVAGTFGNGEVAVFVVGRVGGEANDLKSTGHMDGGANPLGADVAENADYLMLNRNELGILEGLKAMKDEGKLSGIVVIINSANPVNAAFLNDEAYGIDAALWIGSVGQTGLYAVGDILSGAVNPSAKLPFSIERQWADSPACGNYDETREERKVYYREGIFTGYRGYDRSDKEPLFPFGYGLSYTTFRYDSLTVEVKDRKKGLVEATFRITNTGKRAGAEVAQLYVSDDRCSEPRPMKELKGFEKVWLQPGESRTVTLRLDERAFRFFSAKKEKWVVEKGTFTLRVGGASDQLPLTAVVKL